MLDRMGPNIASGPIPRDGFTTQAYEDFTRKKLHVRTDFTSTASQNSPHRRSPIHSFAHDAGHLPAPTHPVPHPICFDLTPPHLNRTSPQEMGYSDIRGEHGERPEELDNGIDHLDKLETVREHATRTRTAEHTAVLSCVRLLSSPRSLSSPHLVNQLLTANITSCWQLGKSAKDLRFTDGFTGSKGLAGSITGEYKAGARLNIGKGHGAS